MSERLRNMGMPTLDPNTNKDDSDDDAGAIKGAPRDYEFEVGMIDTRLECPKLQLPEAKDTLFVTKPIADYEPLKPDEETCIKFEPNPDHIVKKKFPSEPRNHAEIRDISQTLNGE